jgi:RNA polymerase sigma-70 factor (sigma-E family)
MRRLAYLVCGDWHRAEDAVQTAFVKLYLNWTRSKIDSMDSYVRRIVINSVKDVQRRYWFRREHSTDDLPDTPRPSEEDASTDRLVVRQALARLPHRRRVTLVLRYWEDLSVEQTAQIMRCSTATVKSQTARGLAALRGLLSDSLDDEREGLKQ